MKSHSNERYWTALLWSALYNNVRSGSNFLNESWMKWIMNCWNTNEMKMWPSSCSRNLSYSEVDRKKKKKDFEASARFEPWPLRSRCGALCISAVHNSFRSVSFPSWVDELNKLVCSPCMGLHSSAGRSLQHERRGQGFESLWSTEISGFSSGYFNVINYKWGLLSNTFLSMILYKVVIMF